MTAQVIIIHPRDNVAIALRNLKKGVGYPILPVLKVASTSRMYDQMSDDMDIDAGVILDGAPMQEVGRQIINMMKRVLDGEPTKAELNQQEGIVCLYTLHPAF